LLLRGEIFEVCGAQLKLPHQIIREQILVFFKEGLRALCMGNKFGDMNLIDHLFPTERAVLRSLSPLLQAFHMKEMGLIAI
jgi:hypothetical protein